MKCNICGSTAHTRCAAQLKLLKEFGDRSVELLNRAAQKVEVEMKIREVIGTKVVVVPRG